MSSVVVDGLVLPVSVSGHPALDFCNTRAGWNAATPKEYLHGYEHLAVWAREAGLVTPATATVLLADALAAPDSARAVLDAALRLRSAAYRVALGSSSAADLDIIGQQAKAARSASTLRATAGRTATPRGLSNPGALAHWVLPQHRLDAPLLAVTAHLDDLLCSTLSEVIAACPGRGCGWLFADPRRRRRWCDMAVCGNRAKARRHAQRLAAARG